MAGSHSTQTCQVKAVLFTENQVTDDLYNTALSFVADEESRTKIKKYYHRADACRSLIGRLLVQQMLTAERGITFPGDSVHASASQEVKFGRSKAGKPLVLSPDLTPPLAFNITHDNAAIALSYCEPTSDYKAGDELLIGIDVMRVSLPRREKLAGFIEMFREQLTPLEQSSLGLSPPESSTPHPLEESQILERFFWIWVLKEAYTKALGLGLGFDFQRIEYDIAHQVVRVDGKNIIAQGEEERGWKFFKFELEHITGESEGERYVGMVARFEGREQGGLHVVEGKGRVQDLPPGWIVTVDAKEFLERAGR